MQLIPALRKRRLRLGGRLVAEGEPTYVIAEIGINHNGSLELAQRLIEGAATNLKITSAADLVLAAAVLQARRDPALPARGAKGGP